MILAKRPQFTHSNHQHQHHHNQNHPAWHNHQAQLKINAHKQQQQQQQQLAHSEANQILRRPAPQQPAPQRPASIAAANNENQPNCIGKMATTTNSLAGGFPNGRASTLNRLDLLKRRQQQSATSNPTTSLLRRNLSSLGHYPASSSSSRLESSRTPALPLANGYNGLINGKESRPVDNHIYAPASIASPREFGNYSTIVRNQPQVDNSEQHYASTSVKSHNLNQPYQAASSSSRQTPRPESALGHLLERFGTLRRKAKRHFSRRSWSSLRRSPGRSQTPHSQIYAPVSIAGYPVGGVTNSRVSPATSSSKQASLTGSNIPQLPPSTPLVLDPEIYASGKRQVVAEEIYAEGSRALDSNAERRLLEHELDPSLMADGETRTIIEEQSRQRADYKLLVRLFVGWLNDELAEQRIIVRDLQEDLYDGQVLCKLVEKLHQIRIDIVEVTQNELAQKHKLKMVLETVNRALASQARNWAQIRWSVEGIHSKNMVEILHLLVTMALFYRAPLRLPANVTVQVLVFQKHQDELVRRSHQVTLTDEFVANAQDRLSAQPASASSTPVVSDASAVRRDAFDTLLECAPEKLHIVKKSLVRFCNRHLNKINMSCGTGDDLVPEQFSDGLLLVFLISSLEDYFVPLGNLFTTTSAPKQPFSKTSQCASSIGSTELPFIDSNNNNTAELDPYSTVAIEQPTALEPTSYICSLPIEKLHNVNVALQLIEEAGLSDIRQRVRPEEIVNSDLKAVLRVLYALFGRYKHL